MSLSLEFFEINSPDIEGDFLEQIKKPATFFKYQSSNKNIKDILKSHENEKTSPNYVKIPIINPVTESLYCQFSTKCYYSLVLKFPDEY